MQHLVLLSYGREAEYRRAIFAALSFWAHYRGAPTAVNAIIFTDNPAFFQPFLQGLPVEYVQLDADQRRAMHGPHDYVHRVKIGILHEVMQRHPGHDVLYVDTDTFFVADPAPLLRQLAAGTAFMHQPEFTLAEAVDRYAAFEPALAACPPRLLQLLASRTFGVLGRERQFSGAQAGWNSGVLGLPAAAARLLPDVFALTDAFFAGSGWFTSEQLAFSLALPIAFPLQRSDQYVFHYWGGGQKKLLDTRLAGVLTTAFGRQPVAARLAAVRPRTRRWRRHAELDQLREGALYALGRGRLLPGAKYAAKALWRAPFNLAFPWRVVQTLLAG